jgi:glycosyltransferase involved in cell wall biosynthesis
LNKVTIIMPTYNRAAFIPTALNSIKSQNHENWELIVVDDGGTDETECMIESLVAGWTQVVHYIKQENQGPAVARNTGLKRAKGKYVAFYDSDDVWLSHHLSNCLKVMTEHPEVSWVYGACQRRIYNSEKVVLESTFYLEGKPNPLFSLECQQYGNLFIIDDDSATELQITHGLDSGLQNSMMRIGVFAEMMLPEFRIGEDRLFIAMALKKGFRFAFIDDIHVYYIVHSNNISDTNVSEENLSKRISVMKQLIESYEKTPNYISNLTKSEIKALKCKLADDVFWKLGYSLQWQNGLREDAIKSFKKGLKLAPYKFTFWKSFLKALAIHRVSKVFSSNVG